MKHSLSEINEENRTAMCSVCGYTRITSRDKTKKKLNSKYRCIYPHRNATLNRTFPYRKYKKDKCEKCGFVAVHSCQLDVDHIDGNPKNNELSNLQTLCANCHRLKTFLNKDGSYKNGYLPPRETLPCPADKPE